MKTIVRADCAGFCFGVKRAVEEIIEALSNAEGHEVWSIGMPIHNPQEVERLKSLGLKIAASAADVPSGGSVMIRAHGEAPAVIKELQTKGVSIIDATCPFVKRAQKLAESLSAQGYDIVLLGDRNHPEIRSIIGHVCGKLYVVANVKEAEGLPEMAMAALISQTTQQEERLSAVADILASKTDKLHVCNTICRATVDRQDAVRRLAGLVDIVVIIGGRQSANTAKLRDIAEASGMEAVWIEDPSELDGRWFEAKVKIGIAAGASTPEWLIKEVCNKIARM